MNGENQNVILVGEVYSAALYIRLSREDGDKAESDSVGNQKKLLTEYLEGHEDIQLYDIYVDDGCTGTNFDRPGFVKMMEDIRAGLVNCVVVKDLSRFGRDYIDTGRYLERIFPEMGVRFISITDGIDSLRQSYDLLLPIKNIFNEQYARDISGKIRATMRAKQRAGEFIGAFACYGYKKDPQNKNRLIIDESAAAVVRRVFELFLEGKGKKDIAELLNQEGILCPSEYKQSCGENYRNGIRREVSSGWTYSTIHHMLQNEVYTGNMVQGKKYQNMRSRQHAVKKEKWIVVPDTHEAVIDRDIWNRTQKLLQQNHRKVPQKYEPNIFAGLLFCGECKKPMVLNHWKHADGSMVACFYCGTYKRKGRKFCTPHTLSADILEKIIFEDLIQLLESEKNLQNIMLETQKQLAKEKISRRNREFLRAEASLIKVQTLKKAVYEDYREGILSREEFLSYAEDYTKKAGFYEEQMKLMKSRECFIEKQSTDRIDRMITDWSTGDLDKMIFLEMIDRIEVQENHCLEIYYNLSG